MGREAAVVFTGEGARVCVADVALGSAEETVGLCAEGTAFPFQVDVADEDAVRSMMAATAERFGGIDVLYNNAGISPDDDASVLDTSVEAWQRVQDVNTTAASRPMPPPAPVITHTLPSSLPATRTPLSSCWSPRTPRGAAALSPRPSSTRNPSPGCRA